MKTDLTTAVFVAIVGVIFAYFFTGNVLLHEPKPVTVKTVEVVSPELKSPDPEVFNYRALNPTVEVYIDNTSYDVVDKKQLEDEEE